MYEADVIFTCGEDSYLPSVDVWIVIDVLRATSVITRWFELDGKDLYPVKTPDDARSLVITLKDHGVSPLLMGEVNGIPPVGFDLGNSPLDLTQDLIRAHDCGVMSTTNGTVALTQAAMTGSPVIAASFRNYIAALDHALTRGHKVGLLCSGRKRRPSWEDTICAGAIIEELSTRGELLMTDSAKISLSLWQNRSGDLVEYVKRSEHAIYLEQIGYSDDINFSCQLNACDAVPVLLHDNGRNVLRKASGSVKSNANTLRPEPIHTAPTKRPDPFEELLTYTKKTFVASKEGNS